MLGGYSIRIGLKTNILKFGKTLFGTKSYRNISKTLGTGQERIMIKISIVCSDKSYIEETKKYLQAYTEDIKIEKVYSSIKNFLTELKSNIVPDICIIRPDPNEIELLDTCDFLFDANNVILDHYFDSGIDESDDPELKAIFDLVISYFWNYDKIKQELKEIGNNYQETLNYYYLNFKYEHELYTEKKKSVFYLLLKDCVTKAFYCEDAKKYHGFLNADFNDFPESYYTDPEVPKRLKIEYGREFDSQTMLMQKIQNRIRLRQLDLL